MDAIVALILSRSLPDMSADVYRIPLHPSEALGYDVVWLSNKETPSHYLEELHLLSGKNTLLTI